MPDASFIILYVDLPETSASFYVDLLGAPVLESSPTFAMLPLRPGVMLGLWSRHTAEPPPGVSRDAACGGGAEIAFTVSDVDAIHADWLRRGLTVIQPPTEMDFGRSFVAVDRDGHRLRVLAPNGT